MTVSFLARSPDLARWIRASLEKRVGLGIIGMQSNGKVKQEYVGLRDYFRIVQRNFNLPSRNRPCVNCENKSKPQELSSGKPKSYARTRARGGCQCRVSGTVPQAWSNLTLALLGISLSRPLISRWIQVAYASNPDDATAQSTSSCSSIRR